MADGRRLRADARRNRSLLLAAAEAVIATKGTTASTEEVARAAGVGVGTLFRHFPTKEALLEAVFRERMRRLAEEATALLDAADPGRAFFDYFRTVVAQSGTKVALTDALDQAGVDVARATAEEGPGLAEALTALLLRAQRAGAVREDIGWPELKALLVGASRAVEHAASEQVRSRTVGIVLDGLRPPARPSRRR